MRIHTLKVRKFRNFFDTEVYFSDRWNLIYGLNGVGKTTLLELLAGLTGNDKATYLIAGQPVEHVEISVRFDQQTYVGNFNRLDPAAINAWKAKLPMRTSFVLREAEADVSLVTNPRDPSEAIRDIKEHLPRMHLAPKIVMREQSATMFVHRPSGQAYILDLLFRLPQPGVPAIIESPERHLHIVAQRHIARLLDRMQANQLFVTTHSPETYHGFGLPEGKRWEMTR